MQKNVFVISVNGLALGKSKIDFEADKEFFVKFENTEVLDADLAVTVVADKGREKLLIDCAIKGTITVPCDRCLSPAQMCVDTKAQFKLNFTPAGPANPSEEDLYEELFLGDDSDSLDLGQEIYDYSLLALPLQRFHKEGECEKVALGYLSKDGDGQENTPMDTPFASLANMLNKNNLK